MVTRVLAAVGDAGAARSVTALLEQLPDGEALPTAGDSAALLDALTALADEPAGGLPEVVLVHESIGPVPALELAREVALRFPAVAVVLAVSDTGSGLYSAAMDAGARGVVGLPLSYDELAARVGTAAAWAAGVRRHLGSGTPTGPGGTVVAVAGAKGGVGATVTAVQLALAAGASGHAAALVDLDLQAGDAAAYLDVRFRRSIADLAGIDDLSPRVLKDVLFAHPAGVDLLPAPAEGERGEEVDDRIARQVLGALRSRHGVVIVDCGAQMNGANAAAVEMADTAVLVTTPDAVAVRAARRMVGLWERLRIRKAEETLTVVNRASRTAEIQPPLVARVVGTAVARSTVPSRFGELRAAIDAGRLQDLGPRSGVKQALWRLAGEIGLTGGAPAGPGHGAAGPLGLRRRTRRGRAAGGPEGGAG